MNSPWLDIPNDEYEAHMSAPHVGQRQALDEIFSEAVRRLQPRALLVAGCGAGGNWDAVDPLVTTRVTGVDLNPLYLQELQLRYGTRLPGLETVCADICTLDLHEQTYDLIVAALLFEYIDVRVGLERLSGLLNPDGVLLCVLQHHSQSSTMVSSTPYESLQRLECVMDLVDFGEFQSCARDLGLVVHHDRTIPLPGSKAFRVFELGKIKQDD